MCKSLDKPSVARTKDLSTSVKNLGVGQFCVTPVFLLIISMSPALKVVWDNSLFKIKLVLSVYHRPFANLTTAVQIFLHVLECHSYAVRRLKGVGLKECFPSAFQWYHVKEGSEGLLSPILSCSCSVFIWGGSLLCRSVHRNPAGGYEKSFFGRGPPLLDQPPKWHPPGSITHDLSSSYLPAGLLWTEGNRGQPPRMNTVHENDCIGENSPSNVLIPNHIQL